MEAITANPLRRDGMRYGWAALSGAASPKLWMDAYLAAFAIESGQQLVTTDTGFRQFKGLDATVN